MKLTEAEKAQIEKQRAKDRAKVREVESARKTLLTVSDELAVQLAEQITNSRKYVTARDECGCMKRHDELCSSRKKAFDRWFFGRRV
jgi:hypothetical protein